MVGEEQEPQNELSKPWQMWENAYLSFAIDAPN